MQRIGPRSNVRIDWLARRIELHSTTKPDARNAFFLMNLKRSFLAWLSAYVTAVPVSLISTFVLFLMLGLTVNTLSLFGLVLAIGLVVDDAIVVVEAVEHHIEHGPVATRGHLESDGRETLFF